MLSRILLLALVVGVVWLLLRKRRQSRPQPPARNDQLVSCQHCQRMIPSREAGRCRDSEHCLL